MNHLIKETIATLHFSNGNAAPTPEFWEAWHEDKNAIKSEGYFVRKIEDDAFIVTTAHPSQWHTETETPPRPKKRTSKAGLVNPDNYPLVDNETKKRVMSRYWKLKGVQE